MKLETRLRVYEALQDLHPQREAPQVLFASEVPKIYVSDTADLRWLHPKIAAFSPDDPHDDADAPKPPYNIPEALTTAWDYVVMAAAGSRPSRRAAL